MAMKEEFVDDPMGVPKPSALKEESEDLSKMDIPLTFDEIDVTNIKDLPISDEDITSLILSGTSKTYSAWIPIWDLETQKLKRQKIHVKPISQEDWDYALANSDKETSFMQLVMSKCLYDSHGGKLTLETIKKLPIGPPVFIMKEIRKLSGHFEAGLF